MNTGGRTGAYRKNPDLRIRAATFLGSCGLAAAQDVLEQGFAAPPPSARPRIDWFWLNGGQTEEGIPADLEAGQGASFPLVFTGRAMDGWEWVTEGKASPSGCFTFITWRLWKRDDPLVASGPPGPVRL